MVVKLSPQVIMTTRQIGLYSVPGSSVARLFSFSSSARTYFNWNGRQCITTAHTPCFATLPLTTCNSLRCAHYRRCLSLWTRSIPVQRQNAAAFINLQNHFFLNIRRGISLCSSVRSLDSKSKLHEESQSSDAEDICEVIKKRIVFKKDNLIAVNKPKGLSVFGSSSKPSEKVEGKHDMNSSSVDSLARALPKLADKLNCRELDVGLSLKSFYSGIVLLCTNKESKKRLEKVVAEAQTQKYQFVTYLAITVGEPQCPHGVNVTANIKRDWLHNKEMSTVSDNYIHNAAKEGIMIKTCFSVKPLVVNKSNGAALVQISLTKDKWEAVEVLMSHYLSPVLGDHIYSSRTQTVADVPFPASAHMALPGTQRLPPTIIASLQSNADYVEKALPLFVHRHKVMLSKFPTRLSPPLVITAPPQKEFLSMLQCLGLYQEGMFS